MSAVAKSESLKYRDARLYCQRRHQKTTGRCVREERHSDALLGRTLRQIQKSRDYREKELDREQEKCLKELVTIFDRQCQIATARLARRLNDAMADEDSDWGGGLPFRRSTPRNNQSGHKSAVPNGHETSLHRHVSRPIGCGPAVRLPVDAAARLTTGPGIATGVKQKYLSNCTCPSRFESHVPRNVQDVLNNQIELIESGMMRPERKGVTPRRPKTAPELYEAAGRTATHRWDEPVRCPQHPQDHRRHLRPRSVRSLQSALRESTEEGNTLLGAPEDVSFRRQYMVGLMAQKLPVSGLKNGSFAQQDEVRKKMEARRKCLEEMRLSRQMLRAKSAPPLVR